MMELEYKDYYLRTIDKHSKGIKLVLGGTGLGKTHGMRAAVTEYIQSDREEKRKFIYITNRHNLITEQKNEFHKVDINGCYLKSNKEIILDLFKGNQIREMIEKFEEINFFKFEENEKNRFKRKSKFKKLIESIEAKRHLLNDEDQQILKLKKTIEKELNLECDEFFKIFKTQLVLIGKNDEEFHKELKSNEYIWKLFPYIEFENNPDTNVLLVTIQKVMRGFFDGKKDIKISSVENKIIFLDEFDYLEQEIINILCDEPSIINPLEFVRIFYEKFKHWSTSEFWESTEYLKGVRDKFNKVIKYLEEETQKKGLSFPNIIDFRVEKNHVQNNKPYLLFQTNQIITTRPFFLKEKNNSWYIQEKKTNETVSPYQLFNILAIATSNILGVFHYYIKDPNLVSDLIQSIWNQKNDNTGGRYENYIIENCLYHRTKDKSGKDFELYKDKSPYEIGFRLVKLAKRTNNFDPNSAELGQVELFTSPEAVIAKLSDSNLVFALSATADIPRTLKCFNIDWLEKNTNFIHLEKEDFEIIKSRRDKKRDSRQTKVSLKIAEELDETHPLGVICKSLFKDNFFSKANDFDNSANPRYKRVLRIFDTLYKCANGNKYAHLLFVTTFNEFKEIIDYKNYYSNINLFFVDCNPQIFSCSRYNPNSDKFFQMTLNGKDCSIILLNSEDARELQENNEARQAFHSYFEMKDKVFVITQYKSASNGVNLPCYPKMTTLNSKGNPIEEDFEGIHLLEPQHFWFDNSDDFSEFKNNEKQALWYLWKLLDKGQIESSDFKNCLSTPDIKNPYKIDIRKINYLYKNKADEKTLNSIALFHQALGRIERRDAKVPEVDVTFDNDVFNDFYSFLSSENFKDLIETREQITSSLILKIHQAVIEEAKKIGVENELNAQKSFKDKNNLSKNLIAEILSEINKVREGVHDEFVSNEIKNAWVSLREAFLKHDYDKRINLEIIGKTIHIRRDFCFETKFINKDKELYIDANKFKVYREQGLGKNLVTWNLDAAYNIVSRQSLIKTYFEKNGYKTNFDIKTNAINYVLVPYAYQAILLGAIGEQAISFLLMNNGIILENFDQLDNSIFEIVDAKIKDLPIYFDFKNYGQNTLEKFSLTSADLNFDLEINSKEFLENLKLKYDLLKQKHKNPILYILNLFSPQRRNPDFLNSEMKIVKYEKDSCIRIIPSVLNPLDIEKLSAEFESSLKLISIYETASM